MADPYFPSYGEVSSRNSTNRARALGTPYNVPPAFVTADTMELLEKFRRTSVGLDGLFRCYLCQKPILANADWHLDHVFPLALRGTHVLENLDAAHAGCNICKGATTLEDLLTPEELADLKATGWPPAWERLSQKPVDELWKHSKQAARRFARTPRRVKPKATADWGGPNGGDRKLAVVLAQQPDPWAAITIGELWQPVGYRRRSSLDQQWMIAMGMGGSDGRPQDVDMRNPDSPLILPTRKPTQQRPFGEPAFALRLSVDPASIGRSPDQPIGSQNGLE